MREIFDRELALERAGGNHDLADELFGLLVRELPSYDETLVNAHETGNLDQLVFVAHRINGSAIYTGVPALKSAAETLEVALKSGQTSEVESQLTSLRREIARVLEIAVGPEGMRIAAS